MSGLWFESVLLPSGWARDVRIVSDGAHIARITEGTPPEPGDERHRLALPGLPNLHSHAFQRALAGLTERRGPSQDNFWSWRELMYRFVGKLGPEELEAISALAFTEMLEAGFTRVGEFHYLHHDQDGGTFADPAELAGRIAAAAAESGIGLTLLPVFYAHGGFGGAPPTPRQRRFITDPHGFARLVEGCRRAVSPLSDAIVGIAPHSLRAVTPEELAAVLPLAQGGVIHIHIAEQIREVQECLGWSGRRPIEWLLEHAQVDERWCLVHATHADDAELSAVAARGAVVGLCPLTEANLGDGIFPGAAFLAQGGRIGVGSDSNILIDAAGELCMLEYSQRLASRARNVLAGGADGSTGRTLFDAALAGGAQALRGMAAAAGPVALPARAGLAAGAPLDLITLASEHPALIGRGGDETLDSWIFAGARELIDCVWRGGIKLVSGGRHRAHEAIVARYARALSRLRA